MAIGGFGGKEFTYDNRGRVVSEKDLDGSKTYADSSSELQTQAFQTETVKTEYGSAGVVTQTVVYGDATSTSCHMITRTTPTINGLTWKYEEWDRSIGTCGVDGQQSKRNIYKYNDRAQLAINAEVTREDHDGNSATAPITTQSNYDYAYDSYNNQTSEFLAQTIGTVNNPRKEVKTTSFNAINAATTVIARPFKELDTTITYTLDSLGNRISVGGATGNANRFKDYSKRYDASGKVAMLFRAQLLSDLTRRNYIIFRYDPFGHEAFSATTEDFQQIICIEPCLRRQMLRSTFTTIYSGNDVVLTRVRGNPANPSLAAYKSYSDGTASDNYRNFDRIKNEAFSMADTINAVQWANVDTFSVDEPSGAFEAPVDALSTTLQLDPLEVRPPDTETPSQPSEDAGDITPPSGDEAETNSDEQTSDDSDTQATTQEPAPTEGQATASNTDINAPLPALNATSLATPSTNVSTDTSNAGVVLPNATTSSTPLPTTTALDATTLNTTPLGAPTALTALPDLGEVPTTDTTATIGETTDGTASNEGDSALPESINQLSSSEVTLPESSLPSTFDATSPDEITSPDDASVPQVGVSASDSPLDVVMPESLSATVPTIGDGTPEAIDAVAPPAEWLKEKDDALIATLAVAGEPGGFSKKRPKDNDSQTSKNRDSSQQTTGRRNSPGKERDVSKKEENNGYGRPSTAGARDKAERDASRNDRRNPNKRPQAAQSDAVDTANKKGSPGASGNPLSNPLSKFFKGNPFVTASSGATSVPRGGGGINWGDIAKGAAAVGKAIAEAAKVAGPALGRIVGGAAAAVIIGTQAGDGELPEYLMTEEDKAANKVPENEENKPRSSLPDDAPVIRGGADSAGNPDSIEKKGAESVKDGKVYGVSGRSAPLDDKSKEEKVIDLAGSGKYPVTNGKVGVTTVGDIRAAGGEVWPDGEGPYADRPFNPDNPDHASIDGISAEKLAELFNGGMIDNPLK